VKAYKLRPIRQTFETYTSCRYIPTFEALRTYYLLPYSSHLTGNTAITVIQHHWQSNNKAINNNYILTHGQSPSQCQRQMPEA